MGRGHLFLAKNPIDDLHSILEYCCMSQARGILCPIFSFASRAQCFYINFNSSNMTGIDFGGSLISSLVQEL